MSNFLAITPESRYYRVMKPEISYEDFAKLDIRIGTVVAAEAVPETDKLIKCAVDFGERPEGLGICTIVSGIREWKKPGDLVGKQLPYIVNLAPKVIKGIESQGMLLAGAPPADGGDVGLVLLHPEHPVDPGVQLK